LNDSSADDEDRYQIRAMSSLALSGARVLKHDDTFAVFDRFGDIRPGSALGADGLYHDGTRFLSTLRLRLQHERLLLLSSTVRENNVLLAVDLMNPDVSKAGQVPHGTLHLFRSKFLWNATCYEHVQVSNYGPNSLDVWLEAEFAADFVDLFEVRGTTRERRGILHAPELVEEGVIISYTGLDGERLSTRVEFAPAPETKSVDGASFRLHLESKQTKDIYLTIACENERCPSRPRIPFENAYTNACAGIKAYEQADSAVYTANEQFNAWTNRSIADLRMLITETKQGPYPYAGVPWFSTPFGRDGLITALQTLWVNPDIARGVLGFLASEQATQTDHEADAEPGKILHELRNGEMARLREIPFGRYYGSVDSTPLFVMLAAAYLEATHDISFLHELWPHVELALQWMDQHGDLDGDGFIEYGRKSPSGLLHQGWKDSHDSVFHADGTAAEGPIALCEVQGYAYAARRGAARIALALGQLDRSARLQRQADSLRLRFEECFWCDDLQTYALALDGHKRPCRVRSSNAGQCLFTRIADPAHAALLADQLLSPEMFSGWGIRTLAQSERRYNPMSYHNGSIWPHDNALIASGLAAYGFKDHAMRVMTGLFDASLFLDLNRLPELFCGFTRRPGEGPTLYPVACAPQAWAAAAPFCLLGSVLGLSVEGALDRVRFDYPALPPFLDEVRIRNLRAATGSVDLHFHRHPHSVGINVTGRRGRVEVVAVK
jgi:glycogen debranching enzyme